MMSSKTHPVDVLVTADYLITMNASYDIYAPGAIAVAQDKIVAVGPKNILTKKYNPLEYVDAGNAVLMPGLVNAHGHAPMTLLRALADDLRLDVWLMGYVMPVENEFVTPNFCWLGTQLAAAEMIMSGTTTFMDMYYFEEAVADAAVQAGMRAVCAQTVLKYPTPDATSYEESISRTRDFIRGWKDHPLITPAVAPHAPYTVTPALIESAVALALQYDVPLHIHVAEMAQEVENHRKEYGITPIPWLEKLGVFETKATIAHGVHLNEGEMQTLKNYNIGIVHNPSSNMKLASGIAPVTRMLELGLNVAIGTDGAASNNDLDMIEEMRLASFLAKAASMDPLSLPARQVIEMATIMGARTLHLDKITGSLEVGKRADFITISLDQIRHQPTFQRSSDNIYSRILYTAHQEDVKDVMVNGHWLMQDRTLLTLDTHALVEQAAHLANKIDTFITQREKSVLSKLIAIGGVAQTETFEVQVKVKSTNLEILEKQLLALPEVKLLHGSLRNQYDTYFYFNAMEDCRIRYREDEVIDLDSGEITDIIYRLTLMNTAKEKEYNNSVLLSRSRFDAVANRSLRFYQEYFKPKQVIEVHKQRRRLHIRFGDTDFALNFDRIQNPNLGQAYLEIKSRTWSIQDAERKARLIGDLLLLLNLPSDMLVKAEYHELTHQF
ncbi:MAG: amidohydrolase family protein [Anaerolineae bacterium]|nr:amidohydrolase family protein [Anaerolineae bacterium]